jgi:hypothetical protein
MQEPLTDLLNRNFRALGDKDSYLARAEVLPNGQVLIFASKKIHAGMADIIKGLSELSPPPSKNSRLTLWMVLATPASDQTVDPETEPVMSSLITAVNGLPHKFTLLERLSVTASSGTRSETRGMMFEMAYNLSKSSGKNTIYLEVSSNVSPHSRLETRLYFEPGQDIVLGESRFFVGQDGLTLSGVSEGTYTLYYVLRAEQL